MLCLASVSHRVAIIGAKSTTTMGLMLWNHVVGISQSPMVRSHCCSANSVSEEPACSKALQKNITNRAMMYITPMRDLSTVVRLRSVMINTGRATEMT